MGLPSPFFFRLFDSLEREYKLVLLELAGRRAEHLWHRLSSKTQEEDDLRYCIAEARDPEGDHDPDDMSAFVNMLDRTPNATDDELLARYRQYCDHCYTLLRDPLIWSAVERLATSLIERGDHDADAALAVMCDDPELLDDAAFGIRCDSIANDRLPVHHRLL